jgi:hypothetical protein
MSLAFLLFAFLATGADGEIRNVKRAEARAADANIPPPNAKVHSFSHSRLTSFLSLTFMMMMMMMKTLLILKKADECVCSGISRECNKFWPQNNHGGGNLQKADVHGNTTLK